MDSSELLQAPNRLPRTPHARNTRSQFRTEVSPLPTVLVPEANGMMLSEGPHPKEREPPHRCPQDFPHQMVCPRGKPRFWPSRGWIGHHLGGSRSCLSKAVDPGLCSQSQYLPCPLSLRVQHYGRRPQTLSRHWPLMSDPLDLLFTFLG